MMKNLSVAALVFATSISGCTTLVDTPTQRVGSATLYGSDGATAGNVQMFASTNSVVVTAAFFGLPEGPHAFHIHTVGKCDAPDFKTAGGHLNPNQVSHGTADGGPGHMGDLSNLEISANGRATYKAVIKGQKSDIIAGIFDEDGAAVMVHAGPDDYATDPSGAAGARIACGVLKPA